MQEIKAGKPLINLIKLAYAAKRPVLLIGAHGIGKSELLEQAAHELGIKYICRDLSLMEPPDLLGLPRVEGGKTVYAPPSFLPKDGMGLMVFEELNRCERYMRAPCLQLITARCLNDYSLPEGWVLCAAINPPDDAEQAYDVSELDTALRSRFVQVIVVADRKEWLHWARQHDVHGAVVRYVESDSRIFEQPQSNPRAWAYISDFLKTAETKGGDDASLRAVVAGYVGDERAAAFLKTLGKIDVPPSGKEILRAYPTHRAQMNKWIRDGRLDLVESTIREVQIYLQGDYEAVRRRRKDVSNLVEFIGDLPGDLREAALRDFDEREFKIPGLEQARTKKTI